MIVIAGVHLTPTFSSAFSLFFTQIRRKWFFFPNKYNQNRNWIRFAVYSLSSLYTFRRTEWNADRTKKKEQHWTNCEKFIKSTTNARHLESCVCVCRDLDELDWQIGCWLLSIQIKWSVSMQSPFCLRLIHPHIQTRPILKGKISNMFIFSSTNIAKLTRKGKGMGGSIDWYMSVTTIIAWIYVQTQIQQREKLRLSLHVVLSESTHIHKAVLISNSEHRSTLQQMAINFYSFRSGFN